MGGYRSSVRGKLLNAYSYLCGYAAFWTLNGFLLECGARGLGLIPIHRESSMLFHELVGYQNIIALKCPKRH